MISCANKILSRSNNILSRRNKLKNKTRMSLPGFRSYASDLLSVLICSVFVYYYFASYGGSANFILISKNIFSTN